MQILRLVQEAYPLLIVQSPRKAAKSIDGYAAYLEVEIYWYDAGHGFNCDARGSYNPAAAHEARERTLRFLKKHLA